ncbi:hypothetical protein [Streptosporangium sp. NPDC051022]|uniref:hypothetical protein n=1 Tax=Streptosporangium sp. NPDC051022 TaxID=3155752 RepID=UPI0034374A6C
MTSPPLLKVNVEVPAWPAVDRARWRLAALQDFTGRVATVAGAGLAGAGLLADQAVTAPGLAATAAATLTGLVTLRAWRPVGHQRATASVLYLMPGTGLIALLIAERIVPGPHWGEALALAAWTAATWVLRPARLARRLLCPPPPPPPAPSIDVDPVEEVVGHPAAQWWAAHVAVEGGAAAATVLEDIERTGETSMRAVIRSVVPGAPVPDISVKRLSALMDVPEDQIVVGPVPGRGAAVRRLTIGRADEQADPATIWAQRIAPVAMPGTVLTGVRVGRVGAAPAGTKEVTL